MPFISAWILCIKRYGNEPRSERRASAEKMTFGASSFFLGVLFLVITSIYARQPCDNMAIIYLGIQGGLLISIFIIHTLAPQDITLPLLAFCDFGVWMWGSYVLFRAYTDYNKDAEPADQGYCPNVPFYTAFSYVMFTWALVLLALCLTILGFLIFSVVLIYTHLSKNMKTNDASPTHEEESAFIFNSVKTSFGEIVFDERS